MRPVSITGKASWSPGREATRGLGGDGPGNQETDDPHTRSTRKWDPSCNALRLAERRYPDHIALRAAYWSRWPLC